MGGDKAEEPSLPQAPAEMVHREQNHRRMHHGHDHVHHNLHKRQSSPSITEVTATISVIQQINVDGQGNTIDIETVYADSTTVQVPTGLPVVDENGNPVGSTSSLDTTPTATPAGGTITGLPSSTQSGSIDSSNSLTSQSPILTSSLFPTISASIGNSTTNITLSTSIFSNSTTSLRLLNSSTTSLQSSSSSFSTSLSSSSSLLFTSTSNSASSSTDILGGATGITSSTPTSTAGSGAAAGSTDDDNNVAPPGGVIAGGVVGGVAGIAVLVFLAFILLRWKRKNSTILPLGSGNDPSNDRAITEGPTSNPPPTAPAMTERASMFAVPAALASLTGFKKRASTQPSIGNSSTADSETGFYRVSGRKITSVLESGGDGYGTGDRDSHGRNTLSGSSFYRDSTGHYGGPGSPSNPPALAGPLSAPLAGIGFAPPDRESVVPVGRPSPARTPQISQGPFAQPPSPIIEPPPRRPDGLGRSHPSQDGSRGSRFTEEV